ncbi:MAG: pilus assembly protein [Holosporaceae bacterium]|jgi:hypothetical protein|nr:pilus assembly protein [Holosporaceae bacterium]
MEFLNREFRGTAVLETALTLPVIIYLIFFILETAKIKDVQSSLDAMSAEMSFDFMASKNTDNFEKIIERHKPSYVPRKNIKWYFHIYKDLYQIDDGDVVWYGNSTAHLETDKEPGLSGGSNRLEQFDLEKPEKSVFPEGHEDLKTLSGKSFVLTVICDYAFSSAFVKKFFSGGKNTVGGDNFLLWSRSVGICS